MHHYAKSPTGTRRFMPLAGTDQIVPVGRFTFGKSKRHGRTFRPKAKAALPVAGSDEVTLLPKVDPAEIVSTAKPVKTGGRKRAKS